MALPSTPILITLFVAHLFVILVLLLTWIFIKHAQKKHHEHMTNLRVKKMPKAVHHELEKPVEPAPIEEQRVWDKTDHELEAADIQEEQDFINSHLKTIKEGQESFQHETPVAEQESMEARVAKLPSMDSMQKSLHQSTFESHVTKIQDSMKRKGLRNYESVFLHDQLDSINEKIADLDPRKQPAMPKETSNSDPKHHDWRDTVAKDFENLFKLTSTQAEKKKRSWLSFFKKPKEQPFVAMHKEDVEKQAVNLVRKISKRIEGDRPIPPKELDWIEASLMNVHQEIWSKE